MNLWDESVVPPIPVRSAVGTLHSLLEYVIWIVNSSIPEEDDDDQRSKSTLSSNNQPIVFFLANRFF